MALRTLRVRAVEGRLLPFLDTDNVGIVGRYVGRDFRKEHAILANGEVVHEDAYYVRALACGDLEIVEDAPAPEVTVTEKAVE